MRVAGEIAPGFYRAVPPLSDKNDQNAPALQAVTPHLCPSSSPAEVEIEIHTVDASALEARGSFVKRQAPQRW
jgi:hypothetical protein